MSILHNNTTYKIQCFTVNLVSPNTKEKIYNVSVVLEPYIEGVLLKRVTVGIDGLTEKQLNFKEIYTRVMKLEKFEGSIKQ